MDLVAATALRYAGKKYQPGDSFTTKSRRDGLLLIAIKKAVEATHLAAMFAEPPAQDPTPTPEPVAAALETNAEPAAVSDEASVEDAPKPVRRRTYQRRDLTAETQTDSE